MLRDNCRVPHCNMAVGLMSDERVFDLAGLVIPDNYGRASRDRMLANGACNAVDCTTCFVKEIARATFGDSGMSICAKVPAQQGWSVTGESMRALGRALVARDNGDFSIGTSPYDSIFAELRK